MSEGETNEWARVVSAIQQRRLFCIYIRPRPSIRTNNAYETPTHLFQLTARAFTRPEAVFVY